MHFQSQLICTLALSTCIMLWAQAAAEVSRDNAALNALYNNLLQREYAEPVVFPNHQVERKAQRSPSLRLRFGRRSDPELLYHTPEKRWFDEVNQKPIRSPSLRLRFGRRSDPTMPMHSPLDMIMNELYENQAENDLLDATSDESDVALANNDEDLYNSLMHSQKLRNILLFLNEYGNKDNEGLNSRSPPSLTSLEEDMDGFERPIRKPGSLRLRWGRSTGGFSSVPANGEKSQNVLEQKKKPTDISNEVDKTLNNQNKD